MNFGTGTTYKVDFLHGLPSHFTCMNSTVVQCLDFDTRILYKSLHLHYTSLLQLANHIVVVQNTCMLHCISAIKRETAEHIGEGTKTARKKGKV